MNKNISDEMFNFVFEMAFRDATLRSAFKNPCKQSQKADEEFSKLKSNIKSAVSHTVRDYIDSILDDKSDNKVKGVEVVIQDVFNAADKHNVENEQDQAKRFTYGNAQKLVNMTAKYFFILCYDKPDLMKRFKDCHCPMDSVMIKIVLNKIQDSDISEKGDVKNLTLNKSTPWSKLNPDNNSKTDPPIEYSEFQKIVKALADEEGITPIQFDYKYWDPDSSF